MTGRWPLSLIAGNRARTLGARFYADSNPSPPRPRAELASATIIPAKGLANEARSVRGDIAIFSVCE
jgi:hypothetical protein